MVAIYQKGTTREHHTREQNSHFDSRHQEGEY